MLKESYKDGKFIKERELDFETFCDRVCDYINKFNPKEVRIVSITPVTKGVSFSNINRLKLDKVNILRIENMLLLDFEEYRNAFTINHEANVCFDKWQNRLRFEDFGITIYFKNMEVRVDD